MTNSREVWLTIKQTWQVFPLAEIQLITFNAYSLLSAQKVI